MNPFRIFDIKRYIYQRFRANYLVNNESKLNNLYVLLSCCLYPIYTLYSLFDKKRIEEYMISGTPYAKISVNATIKSIFGIKYPTIDIYYSSSISGTFFPAIEDTISQDRYLPPEALTSSDPFYMDIPSTTKVVIISIPPELQSNQTDYPYFLKIIRSLLMYGITYKIIIQ